jgi:hypothetical protein
MYQPNFCSECGQRIERGHWHFWHSRKFCPDCAPRFRRPQMLWLLMASAALFGLGLAAGRSTRPKTPPLIIQRSQLATSNTPELTDRKDSPETESKAVPDSSSASSPAEGYGLDGTVAERPTSPDEVVSICGARTKKGTPCQRRVRGTGRCWQHRGMPAMIPQEKLIITGK